MTKSFNVQKKVIVNAFKQAKANPASSVIEQQSIASFVNSCMIIFASYGIGCLPVVVFKFIKMLEILNHIGSRHLLGIFLVTDRVEQIEVIAVVEKRYC